MSVGLRTLRPSGAGGGLFEGGVKGRVNYKYLPSIASSRKGGSYLVLSRNKVTVRERVVEMKNN